MVEKWWFGRTGHFSTRAIFGAAALASVSQEEANQTLDLLQSYGINHIDVAASYGDAELRVGPWMENLRQDFFLVTKTEEFTYEGAQAGRSHQWPAEIEGAFNKTKNHVLKLLRAELFVIKEIFVRRVT